MYVRVILVINVRVCLEEEMRLMLTRKCRRSIRLFLVDHVYVCRCWSRYMLIVRNFEIFCCLEKVGE
jgi:hypothetical protein